MHYKKKQLKFKKTNNMKTNEKEQNENESKYFGIEKSILLSPHKEFSVKNQREIRISKSWNLNVNFLIVKIKKPSVRHFFAIS